MKNQIRKEMKARRAAMTKEEVAQKSMTAADAFLKSEIYKNAETIMLYMPLGNETDTSEIIKAAFADEKRLVLPVTDEKTGEITPVFFEETSVLEKGGFSIREPKNSHIAEKSAIDVVIVPGIAFDKRGARVGFGKGCYDMFLKDMQTVKIGFCYDFQLVGEIPSEEHDIKMDFVVTEKGFFEC